MPCGSTDAGRKCYISYLCSKFEMTGPDNFKMVLPGFNAKVVLTNNKHSYRLKTGNTLHGIGSIIPQRCIPYCGKCTWNGYTWEQECINPLCQDYTRSCKVPYGTPCGNGQCSCYGYDCWGVLTNNPQYPCACVN